MLASDDGATNDPPLLTRPTSIKLSSTFNVSVLIIDCVPNTVNVPLTVRLSSTVTVPPAESSVRLPLDVSISLSPVTPTCMFPPVKSVNVPAPAEAPPIVTPSTVPPLISAVSATNQSICAVPSINKSCHSLSDDPKSLAPSVDGIKSLSNLPVAVIVSDVALPKSTLPLAFNNPSNVAS